MSSDNLVKIEMIRLLPDISQLRLKESDTEDGDSEYQKDDTGSAV